MKHFFSFNGRIGRLEYGISFLIYVFWYIISPLVGYDTVILIFINTVMLWFLLAQGTKRCHDLGCRGWRQIIPLAPIYMIFAKGEKGIENKYGVNPKFYINQAKK